MAMDGAVPAKDHDHISVFDQRCPLRTRGALEHGNTSGQIPRAEDRGGAHMRRKFYQKLCRMSLCQTGSLRYLSPVILSKPIHSLANELARRRTPCLSAASPTRKGVLPVHWSRDNAS